MRCPQCSDSTSYKIFTSQMVSTEVEVVNEELNVREVTPLGSYKDKEPSKIQCLKCEYEGPPEKFKYFTPEALKKKVRELIVDCVESDALGDLPDAIADLMF